MTIGNTVNTLLGALMWFFIASKLNAYEFGTLNYQISIASLFAAVGILGFDTTLTTFVAKGNNRMVHEASFLVMLSGGVLSIILILFLPSIPLILLVLCMLIFSLIEAENLGKHKFKRYSWLLIIQRIVSLICVPLFYQFFGIEGALYGFLVSYVVVSYEFVFWIRKIKISVHTIIPIKKYFIHANILGISKTLPYYFDKLIILPLYGFAIVGYYQFGIQILAIVAMIPTILYGYILPKEAKQSSANSMRVYSKMGIISSGIIVIIFYFTVPIAINLLFPTFKVAIASIQVILFAGIPLTITSVYNSVYMAKESSLVVVIGTGIFISIQTAGFFILGSIMGLMGLSVSTVFASIAQCLYLVIQNLYLKKKQIN
ncbi:MAG TPA: hypothetical protein VFV86_12830 [Nitrososphaeraceae archaeon]|nr:hypothetical protein [Nitrososphaeraceae archaeon]